MVSNLNENQARIPTSAGVPLKMLNSMPAMTNIHGHARVDQQTKGIKVQMDMQAAATMAHIQKMVSFNVYYYGVY